MNIYRIKILLLRNVWLVVLFPLLVSAVVYLLLRNQPKEYTSRALLYTGFQSGYDLESPEGGEGSNAAATSIAFDNLINTIKAKSTLEEVSIRLLARNLVALQNTPDSLSPSAAEFLETNIPAVYRKQFVAGKPYESVVEALTGSLKANDPSVKGAVLSGHSPTGVAAILANLQAYRLGNSDMLEVTYKAADPRLARFALTLLIDTFTKRYKMTKTGEIKSVVAYFENQLKEATVLLRRKEDSLQMFSSANKIINYDEDSRAIANTRKEIENQIQQEASALAAAEAALNQLNAKLSRVKEMAGLNASVNGLRDSLSSLQAQLVLHEKNAVRGGTAAPELRGQIKQLETRLRNELVGLSVSSNTQEGIPSQLLVASWIDAMLEVDKTKARIQSLKEMQSSKQNEFREIIPVGVALNRLKRDIGLAEQNYLQILQNLNTSHLKEQNINTALNLRVLDEPSLPEEAEASMKGLLVILAFAAGLFLTVGYVTGKDLLTKTITEPGQVESRLNLPFLGGLPVARDDDPQAKATESQLLNQCINTINPILQDGADPLVIALFSAQPGDGKTYFGRKLQQQFQGAGYQTLLTSPNGKDVHTFLDDPALADIRSFAKFSARPDVDGIGMGTYDVVLVELDSISDAVLPMHLIRRADLSLVIVPAHRDWTGADEHFLKIYRSCIAHPAFAVLNRMEWDETRLLLAGAPAGTLVESMERTREQKPAATTRKPVPVKS